MMANPPIPESHPFRRFLAGLGIFLLSLGLLLGSMAVLGPPRFLIAGVLDDLEEQGLFLEMDQTGYRPERGIVLKSVKVFTSRDRVTPLFTAERVHIRLGWRRWLRQRVWSAKITFSGGRFETELGLWADDFVTQQEMRIGAIRGHIRVNPSSVEIHWVEGRLSDLEISVEGRVPLGGDTVEPAPEWIPAAISTLAEVIERIDEFNFSPLAGVEVEIRPSTAEGDRVEVDAVLSFSGAGQHRGFPFTHAEGALTYRNRRLHVTRAILLGPGEQRLSGSARLDFRDQTAWLQLSNTLPRYAVEHLSPVPLSELLERIDVRVEGQPNVDITFGPSPFATFGDRIAGTLNIQDAFYRDVYFPSLQVDLSYADNVLDLENVRGEIGIRDLRGPVSGSFRVDVASGAFRLDAETGFKPRAILSVVPLEDVQQILLEWSFVGPPPRMTLFLEHDGHSEDLEMDLSLRGTNVLCRGTALDELQVDISSRGMEFRVTRMAARRDAMRLTAEAEWDRTLNHVSFAAESTLPPDELAVLIDTSLADYFLPYRIRGATHLTTRGILDFSGEHQHSLVAGAALEDVQWAWRRFDGVRFHAELEGSSLTVRDIRGTVGDGGFRGHMTADPLFDPEGTFVLELEGQNLDLSEMIIAATDAEDTPYTGTLAFVLRLVGALEDTPEMSRFQTYQGTGRVEIREGELFRIPLLLGLSRILSRMFRGFGYASQTDFTANLEIGDGRIRSDDLFLSGRILSIEGEGWVDFDQQVRANLRVQAFRRGALAEAVNLFLWPIRKLIEVRLTGTLDQPDWQLRNIP
jgi:hypothetical protein